MATKRVLCGLSEYGFWGEELIGPLWHLDKNGYTTDFFTPRGKRAPALPPSMDENYIDPPLGRGVTDAINAQRTREIDVSPRLDNPINLSTWFPDRPYRAEPNYLREIEAYNLRLDELAEIQTEAQRAVAVTRASATGAATTREREAGLAGDKAHWDSVPLHPARFMSELAAKLPSDVIIFDEGLTTSGEITRYLAPTQPGTFFQTRGGSLGTGIPGAIGLKIANPDKTVIGFTGDGGSMYTIQALWTAAHHRVGAKFIVCNNRSYKLLKLNVQQYWRDQRLPERDFPQPFDLTDPNIEFAALAQSLGVPALKVETPDQIGPAIEAMLATDGPFLIDLVLSNDVPGHFVYHKGGQ